jgi:hypothetical protein
MSHGSSSDKKRNRVCGNCRQALGRFTLFCPRCGGYPRFWRDGAITILLSLAFLFLLFELGVL